MKIKTILTVAFIASLVVSCNNSNGVEDNVDVQNFDTTAFLSEINDIESALNTNIPSQDTLEIAAKLFQNFANNFPEDKESPDYLLKASDLYLAMNDPKNSVKILDRLIETYPEYEDIENAYFNRANHIDFEIRDTVLAKKYYNEFISKFPDSKLVNDANARIKFISLSLEDLMKKFEAMNAE